MRHEALGCHLENLFHGKELGSILIRHRDKKISGFGVLISDSKVSTLESEFKKFRDSPANSPDKCRRKAHPEGKSCGYKNIQIREDGALDGWRLNYNALKIFVNSKNFSQPRRCIFRLN